MRIPIWAELVYVQYPKGQPRMPYIARAQATIVEVWNDIENAIHFAEQFSRGLIPAFWGSSRKKVEVEAARQLSNILCRNDFLCFWQSENVTRFRA